MRVWKREKELQEPKKERTLFCQNSFDFLDLLAGRQDVMRDDEKQGQNSNVIE